MDKLQMLLRRNLQYYWIIGSNPFTQNALSYILKCKAFLSLSSLLILTSCQLWLLEWKGVDSLSRFDYLGQTFLGFSKIIFLILNIKPLKRLIDGFDEYWPLDKFGPEVHKKTQGLHDYFYKLGRYYFYLSYVICMMIALFPLFLKNKQLIFPMYEPCDLQDTTCFSILYVWQFLVSFTDFNPCVLAFDTFFLSLITYPYVALEMLKHGFRELTLVETGAIHDKAKENLEEIINQHNIILNSINDFNKLFSKLLLVQYICGLISQIFLLYMLTEDGIPPDSRRVTRYGALYLVLVLELLIYSFGGMIIIEQMESVADEAYAVEWYAKTQPNLRKSLSFMILQSQTPSKIRVGDFADLDLASFMTIVKSAFSVYTLLRQLQEEKLEEN